MDLPNHLSIYETDHERSNSFEKGNFKCKLTDNENEILGLVTEQYKEVNRNLREFINQPYGIRELEYLNH